MKKLISSIFAIFILASSCNQEKDLSPVNNFEKEISFLTEMNTSGLNLTVSNLGKNITPIGNNEITLNQRQLVKEMLIGLDGQYFNAEEETILDFLSNYGEVRLPDHLANARKNETIDLSTFEIYSEEQLALIQPFVNDLINEENINEAKTKAISFQQLVINSRLPEEEKLQLLALSTGVTSFAEFVESGGLNEIQKILEEELGLYIPSNGRVMGCSIDTRSLLTDEVVGFFAGLVGGCKAGAAAGTLGVPIPVIGTVTGCVGVGMVGGAVGFVSGAGYSAISQMIQTCGR